jgi:hypothetical protein
VSKKKNFLKLKEKEVCHMPGFDGTGPAGMGSMTGWGRGFCNPSRTAEDPVPISRPGYPGYGYGRGVGRGFGQFRGFRGGFGPGFGFGRRRGYGRGFDPCGAYPAPERWVGSSHTMNSRDELNMLKDEAGAMKKELDAINKRIQDLESESST